MDWDVSVTWTFVCQYPEYLDEERERPERPEIHHWMTPNQKIPRGTFFISTPCSSGGCDGLWSKVREGMANAPENVQGTNVPGGVELLGC